MGLICQPCELPDCTLRRGDLCLYTGLSCHPDCSLRIPPKGVDPSEENC